MVWIESITLGQTIDEKNSILNHEFARTFEKWFNIVKYRDRTTLEIIGCALSHHCNFFVNRIDLTTSTPAKNCFFKSFIWKAIIRNSWFKLHRMPQATIMYTNSRDDDSMGFLSILYNAPKPMCNCSVESAHRPKQFYCCCCCCFCFLFCWVLVVAFLSVQDMAMVLIPTYHVFGAVFFIF